MSSRRTEDPIEGTFHFEGRGYDDPRAVELAEVFFTMQTRAPGGSHGGPINSQGRDMTTEISTHRTAEEDQSFQGL